MKEDREAIDLASELFRRAYECQMSGRLEEAIELYKESIEVYPTAEAYTFLGWTYSFQGLLDEAIDECKKAIETDPDFGNPYNDIGVYLIEKEMYEDAIPWLKKAIQAKRYESYHYPHYNLGRVYLQQGMLKWAQQEFEKALVIAPDYGLALDALEGLKRQIN
ncbi:tetratricopeptide repeat protein [bacterium]|nr:tetratricopeptide repeat protein [bacterium]MCI0604128.1 tetratricopeptide repeat protein [bacterium]